MGSRYRGSRGRVRCGRKHVPAILLSPGGAAIVPYQDGSAAYEVGLAVLIGSNSTMTNAFRRQFNFRYNGDFSFEEIGRGPVVRTPDGTRVRIVVDNARNISVVDV